MSIKQVIKLTKWTRPFLQPRHSTHRQYEALRAYFVQGGSSSETAERFGYTPGSFRVLCHAFRQNPHREFFLSPPKGPQSAPKRDEVRQQVVELRKQNFSIYDISTALKEDGETLSPQAVSTLLQEEGFARLPRRRDEERPPYARPEAAEVADVRALNLQPRSFRTQFGGLFLFVPYLANMPVEKLLMKAGFPGTKMLPAGCAMRSLLGLKLFGNARHSHVMSAVFDEGLALFGGLNVIPKRAFLTEYSCRIDPTVYPKFQRWWVDSVLEAGLAHGDSFDRDFHTLPFHGDEALIEKHYVSKRSRRQKGILAFLAQDAKTRVFYYLNGEIRKSEQNDEILRFVDYWKKRTGHGPGELVFDSKLTTYKNLNTLNDKNINFITIQRRDPSLIKEINEQLSSAWKRIELDSVTRAYKHPLILDRKIHIRNYDKPIRQIVVTEFGHEDPTIFLTNQLRRGPAQLIQRYAERMIIENAIADSIDFFHIDALSSAVPMKINCDLTLTLMASSLYRLFATQIGNGYETAKSRHIFRDFINASAQVRIDERTINVCFQKRAHSPILLAAGFHKIEQRIPWLGHKRLRFTFG